MSESERIADYDHATQKILEEMDVIQTQLDSIKEKASEEVLQIDIKYNRIRKPHLDKRSQLISNIPNFWATAVSFSLFSLPHGALSFQVLNIYSSAHIHNIPLITY